MLRYNNFTLDPLSSQIPQCEYLGWFNCTPSYTSEFTISVRDDLNDPVCHRRLFIVHTNLLPDYIMHDFILMLLHRHRMECTPTRTFPVATTWPPTARYHHTAHLTPLACIHLFNQGLHTTLSLSLCSHLLSLTMSRMTEWFVG